jgi:hypothetical protein
LNPILESILEMVFGFIVLLISGFYGKLRGKIWQFFTGDEKYDLEEKTIETIYKWGARLVGLCCFIHGLYVLIELNKA